MTITVKHRIIDPIAGPREARTETAESGNREREIAETLRNLFRRFDLPNGGAMRVEANGRAITWDFHDSLVPLARQIIGAAD